MLKILTAEEIRNADAYTIANEPIRSIDLMERAAKCCVRWIMEHYDHSISFKIVCGTGNNGGDGLAIARLLNGKKFKTGVAVIRESNKSSDDFLANESLLRKIKNIPCISFADENINRLEEFLSVKPGEKSKVFVIDAIFGTGLNKPAGGVFADAIRIMNQCGLPIISIDMPSGLFCEDNSGNNEQSVIRAFHTLTFQSPKTSLLLPENGKFTGDFSVLDIGLSKPFIENIPSKNYFLTMADVAGMLKTRSKFSHKGNFGHAFLAAGSYGMMGAAVLAAKGCLRTGCGLLTIHIPRCGYGILQSTVPEALVQANESEQFISGTIKPGNFNAVAIGPGIGRNEQTVNALKLFIQNNSIPVIFDADAVNIIAENKTWLSFIPKNSIFTPHPKEFERLAGKWHGDYDRLKKQIEFSKKYGFYLALKGAHTSVSCPDGSCYFNSTGNPGMATGGTGDVLTGMILSLQAQGYSAKTAALTGVFLHGLAGDIAAEEKSGETIIAGDIPEYIGKAFISLKKQ